MPPSYESALSSHDSESITIRERDVATEVMDELAFPAAMYYLWTGTRPTEGETRLLDAMLTSMLSYGKTGSAIAGRMAATAEPAAIQTAIASGVLCVGSKFGGTMQNCAEDLQRLVAASDTDTAVTTYVDEHADTGTPISGLGHPYLHPIDPRAERLFSIAEAESIADEHVRVMRQIREAAVSSYGTDLPINVSGAIGAIGSDMGLSPPATRAIAAVSRAAGVAGEALEERERPLALDIIQHVDEHTTNPSEE